MNNIINLTKKVTLYVTLVLVMLLQVLNTTTFAEGTTVAHWKFNESNVKDGTSITNGNLVINDTTGNGNDLKMNVYEDRQATSNVTGHDWNKYLTFTKDSVKGQGSLKFDGDNSSFIGADLLTVDNAPINKNEFRNGYTIEFLYELPLDWTNADRWMGLLARQTTESGMPKTMDEPQLGSTSIAVSNCKEVQFLTANADDTHLMQNSAWGVSMDKGGVWYHIAIVSDGETIRTFINGAESFRDYVSPEMDGLFADPNDGRFRVGSSYWLEGTQTLDKFLQGNLEEIRISEGALDKSEWIVQNPETLAGSYGNNNKYELKSPENYNFVFIPDTQNTLKFKTEVLDRAVEELIAQKDSANIKGVVHLGDVIEDQVDTTQFGNAEKIFNKMPTAGVNLLMQPGNHDEPNVYSNYFGSNNTNYSNLVGKYANLASPSGRSSYMTVKAGSYEYLVLNISYHDFMTDVEWMKGVLDSNKNKPTIITSHDLVDVSDTVPNETNLSKRGAYIWSIVKSYDQVFMMYAGHNHGAGYSSLTNDNGKTVYAVLADYQFGYNGGNGLFKYAQFSEKDNGIYLQTYSPYAASLSQTEKTFFDVNFLTGAGNDDILPLDFKTRFAGMEIPTKIINIESTDGGSLSESGHIKVQEGENKTIKISPDSGYEIADVIVDGVSVGSVSEYTFNNIDKDHSLKVVFEKTRSNVSWTSPTSISSGSNTNTENKDNVDYKGHWAEKVIEDILSRGYMELDAPKTFMPNRSITRLEVIKTLAKIEKINPKNHSGESLKDIESNSEESGYVNWAIENKIIHGYDDKTFRAKNLITREEMAKVLNEYVVNLNKNMPKKAPIKFVDEDNIGDWAKEYVKKATERGLILGNDKGEFMPKANLSKAETAQIMYNIYK